MSRLVKGVVWSPLPWRRSRQGDELPEGSLVNVLVHKVHDHLNAEAAESVRDAQSVARACLKGLFTKPPNTPRFVAAGADSRLRRVGLHWQERH
jgi:hypothetical protein